MNQNSKKNYYNKNNSTKNRNTNIKNNNAKNNTRNNNNIKKQPNIFAEKRSVKYNLIGGNKFEFKLSPFYTVDKYTKLATIGLGVDWHNKSTDRFSIEVKNGKKTLFQSKIISMNGSQYENFNISFSSRDIDANNNINCSIIVSIYRVQPVIKKENQYYETGFLFWKKTNSFTTDVTVMEEVVIEKKSINIAQRIREEKRF